MSDAADESEAWPVEIVSAVPLTTWQWLGPPVVFTVVGGAYLAVLFGVFHVRPQSPLGWLAIAASAAIFVWAAVVAWLGHRAYILFNVRISQEYVRWVRVGTSFLLVLLTAIGMTGLWYLVMAGFAGLWASQWRQAANNRYVSIGEFRRRTAMFESWALTVEGIVLIVGAVTTAIGSIIFGWGSRALTYYLGFAPVLLIFGIVALVGSVGARRRLRVRAG